MFNFFNKKTQVQNVLSPKQSQFIQTITNALSSMYPNFKRQEELKTFVYVSPNRAGGEGSFVFGINNNSWKRICDTTQDNFLVKNIQFKNKEGKNVAIDLYTTEGLWVGFSTNEKIDNLDLGTINIKDIWEKRFINKDYTEIESLLKVVPKTEQKRLNMLKNTFKIVLNHIEYYVIHDIGSGEYFVIDKNGFVFKITHDPFEAKKIFNSVSELLVSDKIT